jgi:hypothetical protein
VETSRFQEPVSVVRNAGAKRRRYRRNSIGAAWIFSGVDGDGHVEFFVTAPNAAPAGAAYLVDVNGAPTPATIAIGSCDGTGRFILSGTVPSGLTGVYVDMLSIGVDPGGRVVGSYFDQIYFK